MLTDRSFTGIALLSAGVAIAASFALAVATLQPGSRAASAPGVCATDNADAPCTRAPRLG